MSRVGFLFRIKPELKDEYKKAHDEIWSEMISEMRRVGLRNYSIFFRKDGLLFAYLETDDFDKAMSEFSKTEANERWQKYMEKYFVKEDKSILGPETEMLEEVFHMD
ncbi:MAG: L-rhamnose mutarotase [Actinobacteria bacterium]|nr:L-rhamnose mutarotase [Actinomycetota bacterium]